MSLMERKLFFEKSFSLFCLANLPPSCPNSLIAVASHLIAMASKKPLPFFRSWYSPRRPHPSGAFRSLSVPSTSTLPLPQGLTGLADGADGASVVGKAVERPITSSAIAEREEFVRAALKHPMTPRMVLMMSYGFLW